MTVTMTIAMGITCSHTLAVCWLTFNRSCLASRVGSHQGWRTRLSCRRLSINRSSMAIIDQRLSMALLGDISIAVSADVAIYNHQDVQPLSKRDSKRVMKKLKNILSSPSQLAIKSETILRALKYYPKELYQARMIVHTQQRVARTLVHHRAARDRENVAHRAIRTAKAKVKAMAAPQLAVDDQSTSGVDIE